MKARILPKKRMKARILPKKRKSHHQAALMFMISSLHPTTSKRQSTGLQMPATLQFVVGVLWLSPSLLFFWLVAAVDDFAVVQEGPANICIIRRKLKCPMATFHPHTQTNQPLRTPSMGSLIRMDTKYHRFLQFSRAWCVHEKRYSQSFIGSIPFSLQQLH